VAPDVLQRFAERIGRDLAGRPLVLDADSHRSRLADQLAHAGGQTAYELLAVSSSANEAEVHEAYQRLARLAHPHHAARLELAGGDRPLWLLFEQATAAYLALSQPERRRRYDERLAGMSRPPATRTPSGAERRNLARSYYERAEALIDAEDFHFAIELLKQAVHTHPRPEYYVLLGRAQAKNPNWLRHALDSYRKALDLGAEDPRISIALGRLCEEMEQFEEARRHYESALGQNPAEPDARAGLARLSVRTGGEEEKPRSWLGTLLDRIKKGPERSAE
jgi:tetratricopeptide (TPR) repeat protein